MHGATLFGNSNFVVMLSVAVNDEIFRLFNDYTSVPIALNEQ